MLRADVWALLRQFPPGAGSAAPAGRRATQAVAPLRRRAAEPPRQAGQAAHSAPRQQGPSPEPAPPRARWLLTGWSRPAPAAPPQQTWWHSPARSRVAPRAWAEARCPGRTRRAMRWAATDPATAPQPPDAARWCGQRSARWRCWRAPRGPAARASAAHWRDWDTADPPRVAAASPPRSCRPAGHATSSPGSSMKETTRTPPATKPPAARGGGNAGQRCRTRARSQLEPALPRP